MAPSEGTATGSAGPGGPPFPPAKGRWAQWAESSRSSGEHKVALISAGGSVLAAIIAAVVAVTTGTIEVSVLDSGEGRDDLEATITSLENENDELRSANDELQARLDSSRGDDDGGSGGGGTTPRTSPDPTEPSEVVAREATGVRVTDWHAIDLDSDAPDWGVDEATSSNDAVDLEFYGQYMNAHGGAEMAVMPGLPSLSDCRQATALTDELSDEEILPDTHLCVRTSSGAYAYVGIVDVTDSPQEAVTFDITVWEMP